MSDAAGESFDEAGLKELRRLAEEEIKKELDMGGVEITAGIPGENADSKKL